MATLRGSVVTTRRPSPQRQLASGRSSCVHAVPTSAKIPRRKVALPSLLQWPSRGVVRNRSLQSPRSSDRLAVFASADSTSDVPRGSFILEPVPRLADYCGEELRHYVNPLQELEAFQGVRDYFIGEDAVVLKSVLADLSDPEDSVMFYRAGPRKDIVYDVQDCRVAIVTCGGLCPGLNTVIREIVSTLWFQYGVTDILGVQGGYRGFYSKNLVTLNPQVVDDIHKKGGTFLGTSRGGSDITAICDAIVARGIDQVYIVGGDGTMRGAHKIYEELRARGAKIGVCGVPKTIDNDIGIIDKSFGFDTAVEEAQRAINAAHVEATSTDNGIGIVKLMGRHAGFIAMHASLASRDVDVCLIPEVPFFMEGRSGLVDFVQRRLRRDKHCVIVVAEGSGQHYVSKFVDSGSSFDDSGNKLLADVGLWLKDQIKKELKDRGIDHSIKYIDPTYMIRAVPSNGGDNVYCNLLSQSAVHGAMAGFTGFMVGPVNGRHALIPMSNIETRTVNVVDRMWARLLASTGQPSFSAQSQLQAQAMKEAEGASLREPPSKKASAKSK